MLVFSRKPGQSLYIGAAKVDILSVNANQIRIGIDAPKSIAVDRHEVREKKIADSSYKESLYSKVTQKQKNTLLEGITDSNMLITVAKLLREHDELIDMVQS